MLYTVVPFIWCALIRVGHETSDSTVFVCLVYCSSEALTRNQAMEMERNRERFTFLKWGAKAFKNMLIVPPGSGIVHQVHMYISSRLTLLFIELSSTVLYNDTTINSWCVDDDKFRLW